MDNSLNNTPQMIISQLKPITEILKEYIIVDDVNKSVVVNFKNYDIMNEDRKLYKILSVNFSSKRDYNEYVVLDNSDSLPKFTKFSKFIENLKSSNERLFIINYHYFYKDIADSFTNTSIKKQFTLDITRCKYFINTNRVEESEEAINYYEWKYGKEKSRKIMMFTTQALMGLPFQILQTSLFTDDLYLAEIKNKASRKSHHYIFVTAQDDDVHIITRKYLRVFTLESGYDRDLYYVEIQVEVSLNNEEMNEVLIGYNFINLEEEADNKII